MEVHATAMLTIIEKILFILLVVGSFYYGGIKFYSVYRAIARGKPDERFDNLPGRIQRAIWLVLTQQTVFKKRPIGSLLHGFIFYGFVFYFLVHLVDVLEGFFPIHARGGAWHLVHVPADIFTATRLIGVIGFLIQRLLTRS